MARPGIPTGPIEIIAICLFEHATKIQGRQECRKSFDPEVPMSKDGRLNLQRFFL